MRAAVPFIPRQDADVGTLALAAKAPRRCHHQETAHVATTCGRTVSQPSSSARRRARARNAPSARRIPCRAGKESACDTARSERAEGSAFQPESSSRIQSASPVPSLRGASADARRVGPAPRSLSRVQRFLTLDEVAEELATSRAQVYALVRSGDLPAIKLGGRGQWRVERTRFEEWIERQYRETREWVQEHPFGPDQEQAEDPP